MARRKTLTLMEVKRQNLLDAFRPAVTGPIAHEQAYQIVFASARAIQQGNSLYPNGLDAVLTELFGPRADALVAGVEQGDGTKHQESGRPEIVL